MELLDILSDEKEKEKIKSSIDKNIAVFKVDDSGEESQK